MMSEEEPIESVCCCVELTELLDIAIRLKLKAVRRNDKELFDIVNRLEHNLQLLADKNTSFERW